MGEFLLSEIDYDAIGVEEFDIEELVKLISDELKENKILCKTYPGWQLSENDKKLVNGDFEDKIWVVLDGVKTTHALFRFDNLESYSFVDLNEYDANLIKCWIGEMFLEKIFEDELTGEIEFRNMDGVRKMYSRLMDFIKESSFFSKDYLDDVKGSKIKSYFEKFNISQSSVKGTIDSILSYIEYVEDKVDAERAELLMQYDRHLNNIRKSYINDRKPRELPDSRNILLYHNYIEMFFNDDSIDEKVKLLYMPIYLWWSITTVIPMRPSEFTTRLKRACLECENETYFLKVNRSKRKGGTRAKTLPLLRRVKITKTIYELINKYIQDTDKYGESKTLISYEAVQQLRIDSLDKSDTKLYERLLGVLKSAYESKFDHSTFTLGNMYTLLNNFNESIIKGYYSDTYIDEWVKIGDTRHIAFTSLILQGYSPVEVAVIGGHSTLSALDNYTCSTQTYIDTQVVSMIRKNIDFGTSNYSETIDKIFNMPTECPNPINQCVEAYFGDEQLGYCTADYSKEFSPCESQSCHKCSKWWCAPSEASYLALEKILKQEMKEKNTKLSRDIDFLIELMSEVGIEYVDGKMVLEPEVAKAVKRASLELVSNTKNITHLKYQLVDPCDDKYKLLTDIEDLLPTEEISNILQSKYVLREGEI